MVIVVDWDQPILYKAYLIELITRLHDHLPISDYLRAHPNDQLIDKSPFKRVKNMPELTLKITKQGVNQLVLKSWRHLLIKVKSFHKNVVIVLVSFF